MLLFDVRALENPSYGGVHEVTAALVRAVGALLPRQSMRAVAVTRRGGERVRAAVGGAMPLVVRRVPNKLVHLGMRTMGLPTLEQLAGVDEPAVVVSSPHFLSLNPNSRLLLLVHDLSFFRDPTFFSPRQRLWHTMVNFPRLMRRADRIITFSRHTARDAQELFGVPSERIVTISPGIDTDLVERHPSVIARDAVRSRLGVPRRYAVMLGCGPRKNIFAIRAALQAIPDLVVVATGPIASREVRHVSAGLEKRFRFVGQLSSRDRTALLAGAEMVLYPSFYEGFGLPPLEAMALGVPVVASHTTSIGEVVGDTAILIDPQDASSLIAGIRAVRAHPQATALRVARARERAAQFSWPRAAAEFIEVARAVAHAQTSETSAALHSFVLH